MQPVFDKTAPKKPTNLSINSELLKEARSLGINLSATLESALQEKVREARRAQWLKDNKVGIDSCNELSKKHGVFADKHRTF